MVKRFPSYLPQRLVYPEQWLNPKTGEYAAPGLLPVQTATQALTADTALVWPCFFPAGFGINSANIMLTGGVGSATAKLALYEWDHVNGALASVVDESSAAFAVTSGEQGIVADTSFVDGYEPGWYAWALVSDSAITVRMLEGIDRMVQGLVNDNATALENVLRYTFDASGVIAGSFADAPTLTAVESNSNFLAQQGVFLDFSVNPAFN